MKIKKIAEEIDEIYKRFENIKEMNKDEFNKKIVKGYDCVYEKLKDKKKLMILSAGTCIQEVMEYHLKHNEYCIFILTNGQSLCGTFINNIVLLIRIDDKNVLKISEGQSYFDFAIYRKENVNGSIENEYHYISDLIYNKDESFYELVNNNSLCQYIYERLKNGSWVENKRVDIEIMDELLDMFEI